MKQHTPEPWTAEPATPPPNTQMRGADRSIAATTWQPEDARRINACVNACRGIPTEKLEAMKGGHLAAALKWYEDELEHTGEPM